MPARLRKVLISIETITPTTNDHIHRGQDKSENCPQLALESVSRGVWQFVAQHFQNAVQRSASPRETDSKARWYLGLGVYGR
jgi:hypothetical protein